MGLYQVHIPSSIQPKPEGQEISAAFLLCDFLRADISFIQRQPTKSADFLINGRPWELKSPKGAGKRTIQRNLQTALKQSNNIIFDARRCKIHTKKIITDLQLQSSKTSKIKRLLLITKTGDILVIK